MILTMMIAERQIPQTKHHLDSMSFAECVYTMLEDAAMQGFEDIIRWEADGRSFKVYNVKDFEKYVQPVYLHQSKLRSFQRKLVSHGFTCIQGGPSRGAYRHDMFVRGCKDLCRYIQLKTASPAPPHTSNNMIGATDPSSLQDNMQVVGGEHSASIMLCDSAPPLSAHFWKAVLDSQPTTSTSPTGSTSTRKSLLPVPIAQERHPSSTFGSLAPLVGASSSNKQKKRSLAAATDNDSSSEPGVLVDAAMLNLLTAADQTKTVAPHHDEEDDFDPHLVLPLAMAGPSPPTNMVAPTTTMLMRSSYCAQAAPIATSCFLLDPDEPLMFPSSSVARHSTNHTGNNNLATTTVPKKKSITDSMSFSLFSMELDDILLDDVPRPHNNNNQISSRDTLSLQESILCGSWRERLLTTDEDDDEEAALSFQDYDIPPAGGKRGGCSSSSSSDQGSIWSESILSS